MMMWGTISVLCSHSFNFQDVAEIGTIERCTWFTWNWSVYSDRNQNGGHWSQTFNLNDTIMGRSVKWWGKKWRHIWNDVPFLVFRNDRKKILGLSISNGKYLLRNKHVLDKTKSAVIAHILLCAINIYFFVYFIWLNNCKQRATSGSLEQSAMIA